MLKHRIITALVLAAFVFFALFSSYSFLWYILLTLVVYIGFWEWLDFCGVKNNTARTLAYFVLTAFIFGLSYFPIDMQWLCALACLFWVLLFFYTFTDKLSALDDTKIKIAVGMFILVSSAYCLHFIKAQNNGEWWVLCFMATVWSADIGAYFTGKRLGKKKLAPSISPGKTVEGVLGGIALVLFIFVPIVFYFFSAKQGGVILLSIIVTALISVAGDLFESKLKRIANIKDSGHILPGHGGVLDRVDGLLASAPFFTLGLLMMAQV